MCRGGRCSRTDGGYSGNSFGASRSRDPVRRRVGTLISVTCGTLISVTLPCAKALSYLAALAQIFSTL